MHNTIGFQLNIDVPSNKPNWRNYRSFKNFDVESFNIELYSKLSQNDFSEGMNVDKMYEDFINTITSVSDKFAPQKVKNPHLNLFRTWINLWSKLYINSKMIFNKFQKHKTSKNWENSRRQRNLVTKFKCKSANQHFLERCFGGSKTKEIWSTVKPFLTYKGIIFKKNLFYLKKGDL